jgi:hypothetical protein
MITTQKVTSNIQSVPSPISRHLLARRTVFSKTVFSIARSTFRMYVYSVMVIYTHTPHISRKELEPTVRVEKQRQKTVDSVTGMKWHCFTELCNRGGVGRFTVIHGISARDLVQLSLKQHHHNADTSQLFPRIRTILEKPTTTRQGQSHA